MEVYLIISIDVEPDCSATWHYSNPLSFNGVIIGIKEILQPLFNSYDIKPTYLINNVVLEDEESCEMFRSLSGKFELGTHLHPEFIEPQKSVECYAGVKAEANCCFYSPEIEYKKLRNITNLFKSKFGYAPKSFRAGRFSAGINTIKSLGNLGYTVDSSVTPHITWNDKSRERAVDYSSIKIQPFFIKENTFFESSETGSILEVPVSIYPDWRLWNKSLVRSLISFKVYRPKNIWLRPHYSSLKDHKYVYRSAVKENNHRVVLNMMFHNVEVIPGLSPYTKNENECNHYIKQLECFLKYMKRKGVIGIGMSDLYDKYKG